MKVKVKLKRALIIRGKVYGKGAIVEMKESDVRRYGKDVEVIQHKKKKTTHRG